VWKARRGSPFPVDVAATPCGGSPGDGSAGTTWAVVAVARSVAFVLVAGYSRTGFASATFRQT